MCSATKVGFIFIAAAPLTVHASSSQGSQCKQVERVTPNVRQPHSVPWYRGKFINQTLKGYGKHYSFYHNHSDIMAAHIRVFKRWHPGGTFLDVGGRSGEAAPLASGYQYKILERDTPRFKTKYSYYACDLYDCSLPSCIVDIVHADHVLEHLLKPHTALQTMGRILKPGGLLVARTHFQHRYHAQKSYGDYFRYSARALEYLCIQAGLNPVFSGYGQSLKEDIKSVRGRGHKHPDTPPVPMLLKYQYPVFIACYKPRVGERKMEFEEVGMKPVEKHPRFNLRFDRPLSE